MVVCRCLLWDLHPNAIFPPPLPFACQDMVAMKYLSYLLYVLVVGYAIYSLIYDTHKSWYSWILNSLTGCIYTFGTLRLPPHLAPTHSHNCS